MLFKKKMRETDWQAVFDKGHLSNKESLIEYCSENNIPTHIDDPSESANGTLQQFRPVASEAELQSRVYAYRLSIEAQTSRVISILALGISTLSLLLSIYLALK